MRTKLTYLLFFLLIVSCSRVPDEGVSFSLAQERRAAISDVRYALNFSIPADRNDSIPASAGIDFSLSRRCDIILDFRETDGKLHKLTAGGKEVACTIKNGHIIIPRRFSRKGGNRIDIDFTAGELSLNRRGEFLYTLLVPDRACTLFPCFDQPDIKASYTLTLEIPDKWIAVSNTPLQRETLCAEGLKSVAFAQSEPLSTYLFSFVCGEFTKVTAQRGGRTISLYHRENDESKTSQCPQILESIFDALDYMEDYTAMPYPFAKYDCIAIPDFQYGGMEHTGATLYNDRSLFLEPDPTTAELQGRESLLAHETAHMWFGDCVTMRWFDDVWTKEVFANWFAARMTNPKFPQINFAVSDIYNYYVPSYEEDRTTGSNAIQRPLDNLRNAGLIYGNIIYDKAPVMMEKLSEKMGEEALRDGLREYLREFKYSNATWDDLIEILQSRADFDVREWSRVWVHEKGMPEYDAAGACIDPFGNGNVWQQEVLYTPVAEDVTLPNLDGKAYGCFHLDSLSADYIYRNFNGFNVTARMSLAVNLYENMLRGLIDASAYQRWLCSAFALETDPLIFGYLASRIGKCAHMNDDGRDIAEDALCEFVCGSAASERRLIALRTLSSICRKESGCLLLYKIWKDGSGPGGLEIGESDRTSLSYQLMLRFPDDAEAIAATERSRITNPDRRDAFDYICRAVSSDESVRRKLFDSFSNPEGRRPESRVRTALSLLCNPVRSDEALSYIRPALDLLPDVQRYGDIFFPSVWCRSLLGSQSGEAARAEVSCWIDFHPDLNPLLRTKVEQSAGILPCENNNR